MIIFVDSSQIQVFYKSYTSQYQKLYKCFAVSVPELSLHHVCRFIQITQVIVHIQSNNFAPHRLHATHHTFWPQNMPKKHHEKLQVPQWLEFPNTKSSLSFCAAAFWGASCQLGEVMTFRNLFDLCKTWISQFLTYWLCVSYKRIFALLPYDIFHPIPAVQHW